MTTAVAIVLMIVAVALVAMPFLQAEPAPDPVPADFEGSRADLENRKLEAYAALRDAEMDYRMGKLSDADYAAIKGKYTSQALNALAALDSQPAPEAPAPATAATTLGTEAADIEINFCPDCGTRRPDNARFCPTCGRGLQAAA